MVVGELRVELAEALAAETGEEMPDGIPPAGDRWDGSGDWITETNLLIDRATPEGTSNPAIQLDILLGDQSSSYSDPESDDWQR